MLDVKRLRDEPDAAREGLRAKRAEGRLDELLAVDVERRVVQAELEELRRRKNEVGERIAAAKRSGGDAGGLIAEMQGVKESEQSVKIRVDELEARAHEILIWFPNLPADDVPRGFTEDDNVVLREVGEKRAFDFTPKPHWDLGADLGILAAEAAGRIAGSGFIVLERAGARLERALCNFMLDLHGAEHGYEEIVAPVLARSECLEGTAQLPKLADDMYHLADDDLYLIPTGEVPLANRHRGEILAEADLPRRYTALTSCFRREAGAAGKDTRGMIRVHQFNKVEMVAFTTPEESDAELERMLAAAEDVPRALGLPYRVLALCSGDLSFASHRTYDIEVWAPGVDRWLEISSVSTCSDFQARRMNTRYRAEEGGVRFVHTLNGSGTALPRTMIAVLESYQRADGSIEVPEALRPYLGGQTEITRDER